MLHGADSAGGGPHATHDARWARFQDASESLLSRRRSQRGSFTFGDPWDEAFVDALGHLAPAAAPGADARVEEAGERLGRHVFARRMFEDSYAGAIVTLSASLVASGLGALQLVEVFHRTARLAYAPSPRSGACHAEVSDALVAGLLRGFASEAFNCEASATRTAPREFVLVLGEGRDVNRRARPA